MRNRFFCVGMTFVLIAILSGTTVFGQCGTGDLNVCDTVRIGSCTILARPIAVGDSFKIPILVWHDDTLGGFSIGIRYRSDLIEITSVDTTGSAVPVGGRAFLNFRSVPDSNQCLIGYADFTTSNPIYATTGDKATLLITFNAKVLAGTPQIFIDLDSSYVKPGGRFVLSRYSPGSPTVSLFPQYVDCGSQDIDLPVAEVQSAILPQLYVLSQNVPNPFNPSTSIEFAVPRSGDVRIEVFNILGQKVKTLADEFMKAGYKRVEWDGTDQTGNSVASGVYLYRMSANDFGETKKMLLLK